MHVKVKIKGRRSLYLEQAKYVRNGTFIAGYQIDKRGESILYKGGSILHLIEVGEGVQVIPQKFNLKYAELEDAD